MNTDASLISRERGKRKREDGANTTTPSLLIVPPPGSLKVLQCKVEEGTVEDGRIYLDKEYTKKLVTQMLGLPSRVTAALSISLVPRGKSHSDDSKSAKLKFNGSSNHGGYLKIGASFIKQLNLNPGGSLTMEYLYWQRGGGGKDGTDPLYYFTLESTRSSHGGDEMDGSKDVKIFIASKNEKEAFKERNDAMKAVALTASAPADSPLPPPRHRAPTRSNGVANINSLSSPNTQVNILAGSVQVSLTPPAPVCTLVQKHTITSSLDTLHLSLRVGFLKPLLEDTLGIGYSKEIILDVCILVEECPNCFYAKLSLKGSYLSRWHKMRALLGGVMHGDEISFTYMGKRDNNNTNKTVYYLHLKKESSNSGSGNAACAITENGTADAEPEESMDSFMREIEEFNNKYDSPSPKLVTTPEEETAKKPQGPSRHLPAAGALLQAEALFIPRNAESLPSLASTEADEEDQEDGKEEQVPLQKRQMLLLHSESKLPNLRTELEPPSVLTSCANEINARADMICTVAADSLASNEEKGISSLNMHRHRLAKHFVDSGIATETACAPFFVRGVYYDHTSPMFCKYNFKEQSLWCEDRVSALSHPLLDNLVTCGATISPALRSVLRGKWPYKIWMGDMNNTSLLPAGVGVVALEDIPAGSFVAQYIGEYISWGDLPKPSPEILASYREEAEFESTKQEESNSEEDEGKGDDDEEEDRKNILGANSYVKKGLWVGNLSRDCTEEDLKHLFSKFGKVTSVDITRKIKYGRVYAMVYFSEGGAAENAMLTLQGTKVPPVTYASPLKIRFDREEDNERNRAGGSGIDTAPWMPLDEDEKYSVVAESHPTKHLWLGSISHNCTQSALEHMFSKFGKVVSVHLVVEGRRRPFAFVNFKKVSEAVKATNELQGDVIFSITGRDPLLIRYTRDSHEGESERDTSGAGGGGDVFSDDEFDYETLYHRNVHSEAAKLYRVHFAEDTECLVPVDAFSTRQQRMDVDRGGVPYRGHGALIGNHQWRSLDPTIIDSKYTGNATHFMRRSAVHFNLARVQLNVPNGPTKILYYAKRDIVKGEELVREAR